jgi:hypothetical protein
MAYLLLSRDNGTRPIVECPRGEDPEEVAKKHGAKIYDICPSKEEAERRLVKDPTGKADWR